MQTRTSLALPLALVLALAAPAAEPAFTLLPLGVYGGGIESNLTCFALKPADADAYRILIDGGSLGEGIRAHAGGPFTVLETFAKGLEHAFVTHSHLDHVGGLLIWAQHMIGRPAPLAVHGSTPTVKALRDHALKSPLWADFESIGVLALAPLDPGQRVEAAGLTVEALAVTHTVPGAGYLFRAPSGAAFVHLGDTGPTEAYFPAVRPLLAAGKLRALSLECSFASRDESLAIKTGHLTPTLIVRHLQALLGQGKAGKPGPRPAPSELRALARALGPTRILIQHIKPASEAEILKELAGYAGFGLRFETLVQAKTLEF